MGFIIAGIICWHIGHAVWGTFFIVLGTIIVMAHFRDE